MGKGKGMNMGMGMGMGMGSPITSSRLLVFSSLGKFSLSSPEARLPYDLDRETCLNSCSQ